MSKTLYVKASPREGRSHSITVADAFLKAHAEARPDAEITTMNLFEAELPHLDWETIRGKYNIMHGREFTPEEKQSWQKVVDVIEDFKSYDRYVFAVPMWNFSLPYKLKHFIDVVTQPGYTFTVGPDGYQGLNTGKAFVAYARGGEYPEGSARAAYNFQSTYFENWLRFIGLADFQTVAAEQTLASADVRDAGKRAAIAKAVEIAGTF